MAPTAGSTNSPAQHGRAKNGTKVYKIVVLGEGGVGKSGMLIYVCVFC